MKTYRELCHFFTFEDRFNYLKLVGRVGEETFGRARILNQIFYTSPRWLAVRDQVLLRDDGCDLGLPGHETGKFAIVHHIIPITEEDILEDRDCLYDLNNLITTSLDTHNAIHYGDPSLTRLIVQESRRPNDTCPWKR